MKTTTITVFLIFIFNLLFAQKENNMWYFGGYAALDFNSGIPTEVTNSAMVTIEGCGSISDSNGNLLFYSNGEAVWDKNHSIMPNGSSLGGHNSATQNALIVPYPNNPGFYFIFTLQQQFSPPTTNYNFSYSLIDMSLNGGNGDVTIKNSVLRSPISEKIAAVKHANGTDIWVTVHGYNNDSLFSYLVTSSGITSSPVISKIGQPVYSVNSLGYMKFSPDGSKIAFACRASNFVELFDFDNLTGIVSNEKYLILPPPTFSGTSDFGAYGLEFSSSGNFLYVTEMRHDSIFQFDITSNNVSIINNSRQSIGKSSSIDLGGLQMAPNGKIYQAKPGTLLIGVINNPELPGILSNFVDSGFVLTNGNCWYGFPNAIASDLLNVGITNTTVDENYSVFPNPFEDEISIKMHNQGMKTVAINIKNVLGQTVFTQQANDFIMNQIHSINLSFLSKGIYFLEVNMDSTRIVKKIVKE